MDEKNDIDDIYTLDGYGYSSSEYSKYNYEQKY